MCKSYVSILQEFIQKKYLPLPEYSLVDAMGESPIQTFQCIVTVKNKVFLGVGQTKRDAKNNAAQNALNYFNISLSNAESANLCLHSHKGYEEKGPQINYIGQLNAFSSINKFLQPCYVDDLPVGSQFCIKCSFAGFNTEGLGSTKKTAKQNAAKKMMDIVVENKLGPCKIDICAVQETGDIDTENYDKVISRYLELLELSDENNRKKIQPLTEEEMIDYPAIEINTWDQLAEQLSKGGFKYELELIQSNPFIYSLKINKKFMLASGKTKQNALQSLICQTSEMLLSGFKFNLFNTQENV